jgi:hypothetical protein
MIFFINNFGQRQQITHKPLYFNMPSRYLYLKMVKGFNITGSFFRDDSIEIKYMNTYSIVDINSFDIKRLTYGRVRVHFHTPFKLQDRLEAETWARYILWVAAGAFTFWLTIGLITCKSLMPCLIIILSMQQLFYIGC